MACSVPQTYLIILSLSCFHCCFTEQPCGCSSGKIQLTVTLCWADSSCAVLRKKSRNGMKKSRSQSTEDVLISSAVGATNLLIG